LAWTDIVVAHHATGQPHIRLSQNAYGAVRTHLGTDFAICCSLSDDAMDTHAIAVACVILQCIDPS
jgi:phosphopantetheinyl transferase (holo-ACP synthase)